MVRFASRAGTTVGLLVLVSGLAAGRAAAQAVTGPLPGLRTFSIPRVAGERSQPADDEPPRLPARLTTNAPKSFDTLRTTIGLGYVQGADWGTEVSAAGAVGGLHVDLDSLMTRGINGLRLDHGTVRVSDPRAGWVVEGGDLFSNLVSITRGARVSLVRGRWRPAFSFYGPRPDSRVRTSTFAYRDELRVGTHLTLDGEIASDGAYFSRLSVALPRIDFDATYRRVVSPFTAFDKSAQVAIDLGRGWALRAGIAELLGDGRSQWWVTALQFPVTRHFSFTVEHGYVTGDHTVNTTSGIMASVNAGPVRFFQRYQWGETNLNDAGFGNSIERQQSQSMASYSVGRRVDLALQFATQWTESGQPQHWEELQTTVRITRGTVLQAATAVPDFANMERLRLRLTQALPAQFSLQMEYGRLGAFQGVLREQDHPRYKLMLRKDFNLDTPARGGDVRGTVVDHLGHPVPGVRVRLGPYSIDSDGRGAYAFTHVPRGDFDLTLDEAYLPADYAWDGRVRRIALVPSTRERIDLLVTPLNTVHGRVFCDRNGNGKFDTGEAVTGAVIRLGDRATASDRNGAYDFYNVAPGRLLLRLDASLLPAEFLPGGTVNLDVELVDDKPVTGADFTVVPKTKPIIWKEPGK